VSGKQRINVFQYITNAKNKTGSWKMREQGRNEYLMLCLSFIRLISTGLIGGCSNSGVGSGSGPLVSVTGRVTAGNTDGATIRVYYAGGNVTKASSDSVTGTFTVRVPQSVTAFRVEATGGGSGGASFAGTMMAEVRDYVPGV
jgi:hypothetical protein